MLTAAATYARDNLSLPWDKVRARCTAPHSPVRQTRGVVAASESLGGYLLTQACALVDPGLVQGCIADPASPNMGFAVGYTALGPLVAPFAAVNASLLAALCPSCAQYGAAYWTVNATYAPVQVRSRCTHPISHCGLPHTTFSRCTQSVFNPDPLTSALLAPNCTLGQGAFAKFFYYAATAAPARLVPAAFAWLILTMVRLLAALTWLTPPGAARSGDVQQRQRAGRALRRAPRPGGEVRPRPADRPLTAAAASWCRRSACCKASS